MPKRVLLDECLPRHLKRSLAGHDVHTVPEAGWASKENGELLALAANKYDVFVTVDRKLVARDNRLEDLMPLVSALQRAVDTIESGQIVRLGV